MWFGLPVKSHGAKSAVSAKAATAAKVSVFCLLFIFYDLFGILIASYPIPLCCAGRSDDFPSAYRSEPRSRKQVPVKTQNQILQGCSRSHSCWHNKEFNGSRGHRCLMTKAQSRGDCNRKHP